MSYSFLNLHQNPHLMTLNELTTEIAGRLGKELDMQYRQWLVPQINQWRSRLIRNSLEKRPNERGQFLQSINIPMTYGNYLCSDTGLECIASYSEPIPKLLRIGDTPFEFLGSVDGSSPFRYNDIGTDCYINAGMTAHHFHSYNMESDRDGNPRIIIKNKRIAILKGVGIFDEPDKVGDWQCRVTGQGCDWWNAEYPVTGDIANDIKTAIWDGLGVPRETLPQKQDQDE